MNITIKSLTGILLSKRLNNKIPINLCIGTDSLLADYLGQVVAEKLKQQNYHNFVYGELEKPVAVLNTEFANNSIDNIHK